MVKSIKECINSLSIITMLYFLFAMSLTYISIVITSPFKFILTGIVYLLSTISHNSTSKKGLYHKFSLDLVFTSNKGVLVKH